MKFDILDRGTLIRKNTFLEASAGTGKTFAIENLVIRLLTEESFAIEKILIVTFTKASTSELKKRIYHTLLKAVQSLEDQSDTHDYLRAIVEQGPIASRQAIRKLQQALDHFDEAKIFTIHGFCYYCLKTLPFEADCVAEITVENEEIKHKCLEALKDFLRSNFLKQQLTSWQLQLLLKSYGYHFENLFNDLLKAALLRKEFAKGVVFKEKEKKIFEMYVDLHTQYAFSFGLLYDDFSQLAKCFSGLSNQKKELKTETVEAIQQLSLWFTEPNQYKTLFVPALQILFKLNQQQMLKKVLLPQKLNYPGLIEKIWALLIECEEFFDVDCIFAHLCDASKEFIEKLIYEEEQFFFDDLLHLLYKNLGKTSFLQGIQQTYDAAIIDEFQDTDPLQWNIFSQIFNTSHHLFYLIGDPKQSIYSFRNANIYTYLNAKQFFSLERIAHLDTNFRSRPELITAFNFLFTHPNLIHFFDLPKQSTAMNCLAVSANPNYDTKKYWQKNDGQQAIHFFVHEADKKGKSWPGIDLESTAFFPFIAETIHRLHKENDLPYKEIAILVKDRHQASRIQCYLKECNIAAVTQRSNSLLDSLAFGVFTEFLEALEKPNQSHRINVLLSGPLFGYSDVQLKQLYDDHHQDVQKQLYNHFYSLNKSFEFMGILACFEKILEICIFNGMSCLHHLFSSEDGIKLYSEFLQIIDLIYVEYQKQPFQRFSIEKTIAIVKQLQQQNSEDEKFKTWQLPHTDAVNILTIHVSKGLEYEVVFPIGLINRSHNAGSFVTDLDTGKIHIKPGEKHSLELDAEKMRLLYVALTRAKGRLYVPVLFEKKKKEIAPGLASPMELFLAKLIGTNSAQPLMTFLNCIKANHQISFSYCELQQDHPIFTLFKPVEAIQKPPIPYLNLGTEQILSFSSLKKVEHKKHITLESTLKGSQFGIQIHSIFEKLSFPTLQTITSADELLFLFEAFDEKNRLESAKMIFHALKTPLLIEDPNFILANLDPAKTTKEFEFLLKTPEGFLKGFIDLFFEYQNKYYIVDWKTNYLGSDTSDYNRPQLEKAMIDNEYILQNKIYISALQRYLSLFEQRTFKECFGGVFTLFIRGMNSHSMSGIYHLGFK